MLKIMSNESFKISKTTVEKGFHLMRFQYKPPQRTTNLTEQQKSNWFNFCKIIRVWRFYNECNLPAISLMVYGAVEFEYTSGLVFDEGSIECIINRWNITESEMIDFLDDKYEKGEWLFSQDGARYHTSYTTKDWLETQGIYKWPANSPDLTPIEKF